MGHSRLRYRHLSFCAALAVCGAALVAACNGKRSEGDAQDGPRGSATVGGRVVSTVDGHPITLAEVEQLAAAGMPAAQALARLQEERLLMVDAERRGFDGRSTVELVAEQARVQALLAAEAEAVTVSDEELRAEYAKQIARYQKPELRASVHVLGALPKQPAPEMEAAAKAYAERMLGELALVSDADLPAFLKAHHNQRLPLFPSIAEKIPATDRAGKVTPLVKPYLDGLFSIDAPGVVAAPVRTEYGWHAIRVTEIVPSETTPYEAAANALREELLLARRKERVQKLVEQLRRTYPITIAPDVDQTLAKLSL